MNIEVGDNLGVTICLVSFFFLLAVVAVKIGEHNMNEDKLVKEAIIKTSDPIGVGCAFGELMNETCRDYIQK